MIENTAPLQNVLLECNFDDVPVLNDTTIKIFQTICPIINASESSLEFKDVRPLNKIAEEITCYQEILSSKAIEKCQNKIKLLKVAFAVSFVSCIIASSLNSNNAPYYALAEFVILFSIYINSISAIKNTNKSLPLSDQFYIHQPDSIAVITYPFMGLFINSFEVNKRDTSHFASKVNSLIKEFNSTKSLLKKYFENNVLTFDKQLDTYLKQVNSDINTANNSYIQFKKPMFDDLQTQKNDFERAQDDLINICEYLEV